VVNNNKNKTIATNMIDQLRQFIEAVLLMKCDRRLQIVHSGRDIFSSQKKLNKDTEEELQNKHEKITLQCHISFQISKIKNATLNYFVYL